MNFQRQATLAIMFGWVTGLASLFASLFVGFHGIRYIIQLRYPDKPSRTEAYETFGDAMNAGFEFLIAMSFWGLVSLILAIAIGGLLKQRLLNRFRTTNYN